MQRQHVLLSYFETLSVGPVLGSNPRPPAQQFGALPTELIGRRFPLGTLCLPVSVCADSVAVLYSSICNTFVLTIFILFIYVFFFFFSYDL